MFHKSEACKCIPVCICHRKPRLKTKVNYLQHNGCHQYQNVPEAVWRLKDSILWTWNGLENFLCKEICETWIKTYLVFHKTIQRKRVLEFEEGWLRQITNSYKDYVHACFLTYQMGYLEKSVPLSLTLSHLQYVLSSANVHNPWLPSSLIQPLWHLFLPERSFFRVVFFVHVRLA